MMSNNNSQEQSILQQLAIDYMKANRSRRRWSLIFRSLIFIVIVIITYNLYRDNLFGSSEKIGPHSALIDIKGVIMEGAGASADNIAGSLQRAFKNNSAKGIILRINSPGGSPVTSSYIYNEIKRLKTEYPDKKVYAVCVDICGSAGYYVAAAADYIYANEASMVGSIGVLYNGFGFTDVMEKLGIERRLIYVGKYKSFMDPFSPRSTDDELKLQDMLASVQNEFVEKVKEGRGDRLDKNNKDIFSGLIWTGKQAEELGLIDGFGSSGFVARELIKEIKIIDYSIKTSYFEQIAKQFGASATHELLNSSGLKPGIY